MKVDINIDATCIPFLYFFRIIIVTPLRATGPSTDSLTKTALTVTFAPSAESPGSAIDVAPVAMLVRLTRSNIHPT